MSLVTVVIPNLNGMKYLKACLDSLEQQTFRDFEVILVDNGSSDGSASFVEEQYPQIQVVCFSGNTGFSKAVNEGIRRSSSTYVLLLNNDTVSDPSMVGELVAGIRRHPKAFSAQARIMSLKQPDLLDDAGNYYCALGWAFAAGKDKKAEAYMKEKKVFSSCACAAIYRKDLLEKTGLFDEKHFAYLEDVDIGYRGRLLGYENWYIPASCVYHAGSASSGSRHNAFKVSLTSRNSIYLIRKNMPLWQVVLNSPLLLAGFAVKSLFFHRKGFGSEYRKGLREGFAMKLPKHPVREGHGLRCVILQGELWLNVLRRIQG